MPRWEEETIVWVVDRHGIKRGTVIEASTKRPKRKPKIAHAGLCNGCGEVFDLTMVEVTARYADCSEWKCPGCGRQHDDRQKWGAEVWVRMGYTDLARKAEGLQKRMAEGAWG